MSVQALFIVLFLASAATIMPAVHAQWFGPKATNLQHVYVLVRASDEDSDQTTAQRNERRWGEFILWEASKRLRGKFPVVTVTGGREIVNPSAPLFAPNAILGAPLPTGAHHLLRIKLQTCEVATLTGSDAGFCLELMFHEYTPANHVLAKKKQEISGDDIGQVVSAVTRFIDNIRQ
jgi:hypothetical protein